MTIAASAKIHPWVKIVRKDDNFSIGDYSQIDDFVFINAGKSCRLGRFVHVCSFVSIIGGGEFVLEDFAGLSAGCRVITGTDDYRGPYLTNPTIPREFTNYAVSHVTIREHAIVGTNVVIFPGVTIGEGAAVSASTVVRRDLPAWGVYAGDPLRKIGQRDRNAILEKQRIFLERLAESGPSDGDPTRGRVRGLEDAGAELAFRQSTG
ncbi:MAG TPA: acyltransferase [Anaeromyxobacteraceae bacterium]|nr:acyltransferase [Anaeromyxobacteraceae bacterium]